MRSTSAPGTSCRERPYRPCSRQLHVVATAGTCSPYCAGAKSGSPWRVACGCDALSSPGGSGTDRCMGPPREKRDVAAQSRFATRMPDDHHLLVISTTTRPKPDRRPGPGSHSTARLFANRVAKHAGFLLLGAVNWSLSQGASSPQLSPGYMGGGDGEG